jgi:purine-binding chemotaxis protein CheW
MTLTLLFKLAEEVYGLEIDSIQEIVEDPELFYAPWAQGVLVGAVNFHGQILAVVDLPRLLGFDDEQRDHRRIVLTQEFRSVVLTVSQVERIVKLDLSTLQSASAESSKSAIRGIADYNGMMVNILDTEDVVRRLDIEMSD